MKLSDLELTALAIPFRVSFKHSSAERNTTEAIIAVAHSDNGIKGYGEGCPRIYVTGENITSCMNFAKAHRDDILKIDSINSLRAFVSKNSPTINKNPAAWSAIEIAILDLLGKVQGEPIENILGLPRIQGNFQYTAVLGASKPDVFQAQLARYIKIGFSDFKVKISGDNAVDLSNLAAIRAALPKSRIRLDANNLWSDVTDANAYLAALGPYFWALEEPLKTCDYAGLTLLANTFSCKIILDESFIYAEDFTNLTENPAIWIPNIRLSKMGGLLRSLAITEECKMRGIKFIIGAHVGETSILTRAAMTLASAYRDMLIIQEGAYGTYLLERDIVDTPIMFGKNGIVNVEPNDNTGFGLNVSLCN